jgi:hypothetical protein
MAFPIDHADEPVAENAAALGRSFASVKGMRDRLVRQGRNRKRQVPFTEDDLALLADPTLTHAEIAHRTGRSRKVIARGRWQRGIRDPRRASQRLWSPEELEHLVALHDRPTREVAELMGRTFKAVQNQRDKLLQEGRTPPRRRRRACRE